jgi:hypothetical protein
MMIDEFPLFGFGESGEVEVVWNNLSPKWLFVGEPTRVGRSGHYRDIDACTAEFRRMRPLTIPEPRYVAPPIGDHVVVRPHAGIPYNMFCSPGDPSHWGPEYD